MIRTYSLGGLALVVLLAGCGERELILPGERLALREDDPRLLADTAPQVDAGQGAHEAVALSLPAQNANANWTHRNGNPAHRITHPALAASVSRAWSADIGQGENRKLRITADPVVADGRVFTLDAQARVTAFGTGGGQLWARDLTPDGDRASDGSGGGLAVSGGRLFVSSGFGRLTALDVETGAVIWEQRLDASGSAAPTVVGDLVYLVSRDNTAWAVEADNGRVRWTLQGTPSPANLTGGAAPAVGDQFVFFPFGSGEVVAAFRQGGVRIWNAPVSGQRPGRAYTRIGDITGDPVLSGDRLYVGNPTGRMVALEAANGARIWTARDGAMSPVWPVGDAVFLVSDLGELVRLDASDGSRVWSVQLPERKERRRPRRVKSVYAHFGPVLAGGRLYVASSDGLLRGFDPLTGALAAQHEIPGGAATAPVVAGGMLYVVASNGQLHAFR